MNAGALQAVNTTTGSLLWSLTTDVAPGNTPVIGADGTVYVDDWSGGYVYSISPDGDTIWSYEVGAPNTYEVRGSMSIGKDRRFRILVV